MASSTKAHIERHVEKEIQLSQNVSEVRITLQIVWLQEGELGDNEEEEIKRMKT